MKKLKNNYFHTELIGKMIRVGRSAYYRSMFDGISHKDPSDQPEHSEQDEKSQEGNHHLDDSSWGICTGVLVHLPMDKQRNHNHQTEKQIKSVKS